jgi:hypothetical protein
MLEEPIGTPARSVARPEGDIIEPNPAAGLVGRKELPPKNYTEKLMGMVDIPTFMLDQRSGIPEIDRYINQEVGPLINARSKRLLNSPTFKKANVAQKHLMAKNLLTQAREDVREKLNAGWGPGEMRDADARRVWLTLPQSLRDEAKTALNISKGDRELTKIEVDQLRNYLGKQRDFYQERTK